MGGAPPPPLGSAPQGGKKVPFFRSSPGPGTLTPEDQLPAGGWGDPHHYEPSYLPERWFGFLHRVLLRTSTGTEQSAGFCAPVSQQDTCKGPKLAEMSRLTALDAVAVVSVTTSACAADNIAECVEHVLTADEADVIRRQSPVIDRTLSIDVDRHTVDLDTISLPAADVTACSTTSRDSTG